ncbi:MAG: hypothetical protein H0U98_12125 [Alphaproteobacteria bacterium]|nr:hypothetical protein [Alphaproteobacteria bacterium]
MRLHPALAGLLLATAAAAQPVQPVPTVSAPVGDLLASAPSFTIGNGQIVAHIAPPGPNAFYRGTRFDQAGVVTSLTVNGREFYGPWFDRTAPEVLDYAYDKNGALVAGPDSATSGPAEEFAPLDFAPSPGLFVKIGVGTLRQPDTQPYDHYRHYEIVDAGKWTVSPSQTGVTFSQSLKLAETAYTYEKILRLVPGKPELVIEHRLTNTGSKPINTTVYDHNFLRLVQGNAGTQIKFPFPLTVASKPPPPDLIGAEGKALTYLRPMKFKERVSFLVTGFGNTAADYDIAIRDAAGAGVTIQGDQPITRLNIFSIEKVQSVEPYIAIDLAPGAEKRWRYNYSFKTE